LVANDFQKALSDCAGRRCPSGGRLRVAKSTAAKSGAKRRSEKSRRMVGRWDEPEGTYLELAKGGDQYEIRLRDLDKVQSYQGTATGDSISFERNGKAQTIRSGTDSRRA